MIALRRMATGYGVFPAAVKPYRAVSTGLTAQGNPFNEDRNIRADWAEGLSVKAFHGRDGYSLFPLLLLQL